MGTGESFGLVVLILAGAVITVPLFKKLKVGAILGYLILGVVLGPFGLDSIPDPNSVLHFAEIGVVLLLFVIGLELNPQKLWSMRQHILGLGLGQLVISSAVIFIVLFLLLGDSKSSLVVALALALSSTAFAIQLMAEKGILARPTGRRGFAILLLQDLAVIPILLVVGWLAVNHSSEPVTWYWSLLSIAGLLLLGMFVLIPLLGIVARHGSRETMTAASLLIVIGAAYLMYVAGLSMGMGAFLAGMLLANSTFRHQLESDIEPFKGITLGLFFIAIGMTLDLALLWKYPILIVAAAVFLMAAKTIIIALLMRASGVALADGIKTGLMLSQGGEFAFVVMAQATAGGVLSSELANYVNLVVGISMALTSPLIAIIERLLQKKLQEHSVSADDLKSIEESEILILGFGRFGQTTGRILAANRIPFTAIDIDSEHIDFVTRFGNRVFFGDATRLDVLEAAGLHDAKLIVVAIDDAAKNEAIVRLIKTEKPAISVIARAHNRSSYWGLREAGANQVVREMFKGSLDAAEHALSELGYTTGEALRTVERFEKHDEELLNKTYKHRRNADKLIEIGKQGRADLERLFNEDRNS